MKVVITMEDLKKVHLMEETIEASGNRKVTVFGIKYELKVPVVLREGDAIEMNINYVNAEVA